MAVKVLHLYLSGCERGFWQSLHIYRKNVPTVLGIYTRALQRESSISPLLPGPKGPVVTNDWCNRFACFMYSFLKSLHGVVVELFALS